jgi:glyoxylase-like metal-dependent hydrolase (beta-lactamase superfamily II)
MRISKNVEMFELNTVLANGQGVINPVIIWDEKDVILFDAGLPDMWALFQKAAVNSDIPFERLNKILITHSDMDHIGSLAQLLRESDKKITVYAHKEEKPYIEAEVPPVRVKQMEERITLSTGEMRERLTEMTEGLKRSYPMFKANVDRTVEDGEILPLCGGITCIYTPGHTPGHMCYYFEKLHLLVAGDILQINAGRIFRCPDFTTIEEEALQESLKKLSSYEIKAVACYHGGLLRGEITTSIREISRIGE